MSSSDDNSDNENCLRKRVLPVANFDNYDENVPPKSGEEYLRRVQLEEQKFPEILSKDITKIIKPDNKSINLNLMSKDFFYLNDDHVPDSEWIDQVISEFSNLRLQIKEIKRKNEKLFESNYSKYENLDMIWWKDVFNNSDQQHLPLISIVLNYPQEHIKNGLKFITKYLKESKKLNLNQAKWIYSLLACLELPLPSEFYYNLRNLSCVCSYIRQKYTIEFKDQIRSLNLIIYLIGKYFNQYDLIDGYAMN